MPHIENDQVFDNHTDECFILERLSLYATIRPEDIKSLGADQGLVRKPRAVLRRSLQDLFQSRHELPTPEEGQGSSSSLESLADDTPVIQGRDFPISYKSAGIKTHELAVIGKEFFFRKLFFFIHQVHILNDLDCL